MKRGIVILAVFATGICRSETNVPVRIGFPRWGPSVRAASIYNFDTDIDGGGSFSVNRYYLEAGIARMWRFDRMLSLSVGYGQDDYRFRGVAAEPWNNIDNYRIGLFGRWAMGDGWKVIAGPSIRSYGESGIDLDDGLTAAFFSGVSYKFSDRLTLGPGFGVVEQLEDNTSVFPILLVNWAITERLSMETGGGLAATAGPGLSLIYELADKWKMGLTGRYERKRFRLDSTGLAKNGVGEDRNIPVILTMNYYIYSGAYIGSVLGINIDGKLRAYSESGQNIYNNSYKSSVNAGLVAAFRF
jgi:hypothetical protein